MKKEIAVGTKFSRLTIDGAPSVLKRHKKYPCICDCGKRKLIYETHLLRGNSRSCGCLAAETTAARSTTHGMENTQIYRAWRAMIDRCELKTCDSYSYYGGRGISVCPEWRDSFEVFYKDMGPKPTPAHTLDRMNNESDYEPGNCRWATRTEQSRNKRRIRNSSSGIVGVHKHESGKWVATIGVGLKSFYLGIFPDIKSAHAARIKAEDEWWKNEKTQNA